MVVIPAKAGIQEFWANPLFISPLWASQGGRNVTHHSSLITQYSALSTVSLSSDELIQVHQHTAQAGPRRNVRRFDARQRIERQLLQ